MKRVAVVLFNLGGPDSKDAVRPFLFNLFNDPAIIRLPGPLRWLVARLISRRRAPTAGAIYDRIGGRSPILELTQAQGAALEAALACRDVAAKTFIAMRYWHPRAAAAVAAVRAYAPDEVVLLPLYPQFSTTTTQSSLTEWEREAKAAGLDLPACAVRCYPEEPGLAQAYAGLLRDALAGVPQGQKVRVLFSAHGLPRRIVDAGDPYPSQVERTVQAILASLDRPGLDWTLCYQSRVGPLEWIGPSTDDEVRRAGADRTALVVLPVAFVSEHSETLVELDIEYRHLAEQAGVPLYIRVPAVGTAPPFIEGLAGVVCRAMTGEGADGEDCVRPINRPKSPPH